MKCIEHYLSIKCKRSFENGPICIKNGYTHLSVDKMYRNNRVEKLGRKNGKKNSVHEYVKKECCLISLL